MTPRPHSTPTPPSTTPSPRSTPSPRCVSSPSTSTTTGMKDPLPPPQSINSTASSTTQSTGTVTVSNGNSAGPKLPEANSQSRSVLPLSNASTQNPPTKTVSPGGGKAAPKSPGRGRGASSSPTILSIAQSLANRQMQQRATTAVTPANTTTTTTSTPTTTQIGGTHQAYTTVANTPVYPGTVGGGLVSPALAAAAYISAYGDAAALQDVTAMRNLITLSQTAACIRELNLAAMVKTLPRPSDPAPIDLSPTSKAAPHTPLTNGRPLTSTTSMTATKTTASKSPSKAARSSTIPNTPTISPPTPEVTITKLPNTPASAPSTNTPSSGMAKTSFGTAKLGSSNTNTVSITKRPASSKISVTKSPANASVRQIPNPSFVRHQSEARNNNNVSKASPTVSGSSHTVTNTTTAKSAARQTGGGVGRAAGNSPLKETGPLPETSSILKIEHLTRSLAAPAAAAAAAAAAHGFNFFDNR